MDSLDEILLIGVIVDKAINKYYLQIAGGREIETDAKTATDFIEKAKAEAMPISIMYLIPLPRTRR